MQYKKGKLQANTIYKHRWQNPNKNTSKLDAE